MLCLIQQHNSIQYKQNDVCVTVCSTHRNKSTLTYALQLSVVQKTKKLYEMLIWNKEEKFSSKQDKI